MDFSALKSAVVSKTARQVLLTKKHSPKILFIAGTVGVVGTVILACKATLKLDEVLEVAEGEKDKAREAFQTESMTESDYKRRLLTINLATTLTVTKRYLPAIGLGVVSIASLTGSHVILTKRNTALGGLYAASHAALEQYRERVRAELGEEKEREFAYGVEKLEVDEKMADGTTKTTTVHRINKGLGNAPYAVVFDARSFHFTKAPGGNRDLLASIQQHMNDKLRANGHLFLNDVLKALDLPLIMPAGQMVGWVWDPNNELPGKRDNYVSFGIYNNPDKDWVERFEDGREAEILLDFNVDGEIYRLL